MALAVYDSAKVRYAARSIRRLVDCLDVEVRHVLTNEVDGQDALRGKAAEAMEDSRQMLIHQTNKLGRDMEAIARVLNTYARLMEEADEKLAEEF